MRGKGPCQALWQHVDGITPAYAGKRLRKDRRLTVHQDHPRLCGEKPTFCIFVKISRGSPPPMRGKAVQLPVVISTTRITPAYAGKSIDISKWNGNIEDHPRLCGEKNSKSTGSSMAIGSPPPMRGKVSLIFCKYSRTGITPAYAGKRNRDQKRHTGKWDHPRLCGEKLSGKFVIICLTGITPAYAGKS